ncbi:MAG: hypothetical protein GX633_09600 [Clostridiales bacterium]|nr:hypothetical protein [Clostridiales bacterium]
MQKFNGYRIKGKNIEPLETVLKRARENIKEAATEEYHRLLSEEIAELVDDIVMNIKPRPDCPIVQAARSLLDQRIIDSENLNSGTEFNLCASVQIIPDGDGYTYLILSAANPIIESAFASTPGIEDYTTPLETDNLKGSEATIQSSKWMALCKKYNGESSILTATLTSRIEFDASRLRTLSKNDRASARARRHLTTLLLNRYACGRQIPNDQLMRMLDYALLRLMGEAEEIELNKITQELLGLLPDYTIDEIMRDPRAPVKENSEVEEINESE